MEKTNSQLLNRQILKRQYRITELICIKCKQAPQNCLIVNCCDKLICKKCYIQEKRSMKNKSVTLQIKNQCISCKKPRQYKLKYPVVEDQKVKRLVKGALDQYQIFLKTNTGKSLTTAQQLFENVEDKLNLKSINDLRLKYKGLLVERNQGQLLRSIGIAKNQTIFQCGRLNGGAAGLMKPIRFNSLKNVRKMQFVKDKNLPTSSWCIVTPGISFSGYCQNKKCEAYQNQVWVCKGYGKFNMCRQVKMTKCPKCSQFLQNVENLGFYFASVKIQGMIDGKRQLIKTLYRQDQSEFHTFIDTDQNQENLVFLDIEVIKFEEQFPQQLEKNKMNQKIDEFQLSQSSQDW